MRRLFLIGIVLAASAFAEISWNVPGDVSAQIVAINAQMLGNMGAPVTPGVDVVTEIFLHSSDPAVVAFRVEVTYLSGNEVKRAVLFSDQQPNVPAGVWLTNVWPNQIESVSVIELQPTGAMSRLREQEKGR